MELKNDFFQNTLKITYPTEMILHYNLCHATELLQRYQLTEDKQTLVDANYNIRKVLEVLKIQPDDTNAIETDTELERKAKEVFNQIVYFIRIAKEKQQNS